MRFTKLYNWLPVFLIVAGLFYSSSQPYQKQDLRPEIGRYVDLERVKENYSNVKFYYSGSEVSVEAKGPASFVEFFIRKGTHFAVFFALGFFALRALIRSGCSTVKAPLFAGMLVLGLAAFDEYHQKFTENRTPLVGDVWIDAAGGMTAILIASLIYRFTRKNKKSSFRR
jgi:VanZ family protein